eukprot:Nk52_evm7s2622 gene=Nk52_evmTU7s2622
MTEPVSDVLPIGSGDASHLGTGGVVMGVRAPPLAIEASRFCNWRVTLQGDQCTEFYTVVYIIMTTLSLATLVSLVLHLVYRLGYKKTRLFTTTGRISPVEAQLICGLIWCTGRSLHGILVLTGVMDNHLEWAEFSFEWPWTFGLAGFLLYFVSLACMVRFMRESGLTASAKSFWSTFLITRAEVVLGFFLLLVFCTQISLAVYSGTFKYWESLDELEGYRQSNLIHYVMWAFYATITNILAYICTVLFVRSVLENENRLIYRTYGDGNGSSGNGSTMVAQSTTRGSSYTVDRSSPMGDTFAGSNNSIPDALGRDAVTSKCELLVEKQQMAEGGFSESDPNIGPKSPKGKYLSRVRVSDEARSDSDPHPSRSMSTFVPSTTSNGLNVPTSGLGTASVPDITQSSSCEFPDRKRSLSFFIPGTSQPGIPYPRPARRDSNTSQNGKTRLTLRKAWDSLQPDIQHLLKKTIFLCCGLTFILFCLVGANIVGGTFLYWPESQQQEWVNKFICSIWNLVGYVTFNTFQVLNIVTPSKKVIAVKKQKKRKSKKNSIQDSPAEQSVDESDIIKGVSSSVSLSLKARTTFDTEGTIDEKEAQSFDSEEGEEEYTV